jgi:hypothetical protein
MLDFTAQGDITVDELNDRVRTNLQILAQLTGRLADTQKELEKDDFGGGSRLTGHLPGIMHAVDKLGQEQPAAVQGFHRHVEDFKRRYARECQFLLLVTFLDPSAHFTPGSPCPDGERGEMLQLLEVLVEEQLGREAAEQADWAEEPGNDDLHTDARASQTPTLPAAGQISLYAQIRGAGSHPRAFWLTAHQAMRQLAQVAVRVLSVLTTSASAGRAFSVGRKVCGDPQMAMTQETVASRVMIQANWALAGPLVVWDF